MKQWFCPCSPWYFRFKELQCAALSYRGSRHAQSQTVKSRTAVAASQQLFRWPKYKLSALHSNELWKEREAKVAFRCVRRLPEHFGENFGVKGAAALLTTSAYINQNCSKKSCNFPTGTFHIFSCLFSFVVEVFTTSPKLWFTDLSTLPLQDDVSVSHLVCSNELRHEKTQV